MSASAVNPGGESSPRSGVPLAVWVLTGVFAVMAFVAIVGAFLFAFPLGDTLGYAVGGLNIAAGIGYAVLAWRLRRGERLAWVAALLLVLLHQGGLLVEFFIRYGTVPLVDLPFAVLMLVTVGLLVLPSTRRFFGVNR